MSRRKATRGPRRQGVASVDTPPEIQAGAPLPVILTALSRAGWGELSGNYYGAVRLILVALGALLGASGQGDVTAAQIADASGVSERWVRRKLAELEDAKLIVWDRGGVQAGRPVPGFMRVSKRALADMTNRARKTAGPKALARATETARRIAAAGLRWTKRGTSAKRPTPCGTQREPSPLKRETGGHQVPRPVTGTLLSGPRPAVGSRFAAVRALMQMQQQAVAAPA